MTHGHFESTFSKYAFGRGGGHKKEYAVYARENDDNYGWPLKHIKWNFKMFDGTGATNQI